MQYQCIHPHIHLHVYIYACKCVYYTYRESTGKAEFGQLHIEYFVLGPQALEILWFMLLPARVCLWHTSTHFPAAINLQCVQGGMVSQHGELTHKSWQPTVLLSNQNHGIRKSPEFNGKAATLYLCYQVPTCSWNCTRSAQSSPQAVHVILSVWPTSATLT